MSSPANLFRTISELIFVLLGGLLIWVGLSGRFVSNFNPRQPAWLGLGVLLVFWGARGLAKKKQPERVTSRVGGASLVLVGLMMLSLALAQLRWAGTLLAVAGGILVLRGLIGTAFSIRAN